MPTHEQYKPKEIDEVAEKYPKEGLKEKTWPRLTKKTHSLITFCYFVPTRDQDQPTRTISPIGLYCYVLAHNLNKPKKHLFHACTWPKHTKKNAIQLGFAVLCLHMTKIDLCDNPIGLSYFVPTHDHNQPLLLHAYT